jgi:hypothetical protein
MGDVSLQWERLFPGVSRLKSLVQSKPNLAQMMTVLTSGEGTKCIVITSGVSSARCGEVAAFDFFFGIILNIIHSLSASAHLNA